MSTEVKSMDIKKTQSSPTEQALSQKKAQEFVTEIKGEIRKITWTNREELLTYTKIVIAMTFIFGMLIYFMDLAIQGTLYGLNYLLYLIAG